MAKRILVVAASPRKDGNSDLLCERFIEGALEAGNIVEEVFLREQVIGFCRACDYCRDRDGACALRDDAASVLDKMAEADVVVSRAGATSLAEISARALPALLVPFPFATEDHQTMNAQACVEAGAAYLVADADVEGPEFARKLCELIEDEDVRARMAAAARAQKTRDAAGLLADAVMEAARAQR